MNDDWSMLINIAHSLYPVQQLISGAAYLMGILFAIKALLALKQHGSSQASMSSNSSLKEPLVYLLIAGILIYFPSGFELLMNSTFGYSSVLSYGDVGTMSTLFGGNDPLGEAVTTIVQTIGLYAFVRGWVLIARATSTGQPPGGVGKGLTHIFGGIVAMNIVGTMEMINNTIMGV